MYSRFIMRRIESQNSQKKKIRDAYSKIRTGFSKEMEELLEKELKTIDSFIEHFAGEENNNKVLKTRHMILFETNDKEIKHIRSMIPLTENKAVIKALNKELKSRLKTYNKGLVEYTIDLMKYETENSEPIIS